MNPPCCPHYYAASLDECKQWTNNQCQVFSQFEKLWLQQHQATDVSKNHRARRPRNAWACHAVLAGRAKFFYESFGRSCKSAQVKHLKITLYKMTAAMGDLHSMIRVVNGMTAILIKTTNTMTRKLNSLIQDIRVIDTTLQNWQNTLHVFGKTWKCTTNMILEFLGKLAGHTVEFFFTLLRLIEAEDIIRQAKRIEDKTLIGYSELPDFVITELSRQLQLHDDMATTIQALHAGYPLLMEPLVNARNTLNLNILMTIPQIKDTDAICTLEYFTPIKYNISGTCYTGPVTRNDLALVTCPNSCTVIRTVALGKCAKQDETFLCSELVLPREDDIQWLGMHWTPTSKFTYQRRHTLSADCSSVKPLIHLGGRYYLSTTNGDLRIKNKAE